MISSFPSSSLDLYLMTSTHPSNPPFCLFSLILSMLPFAPSLILLFLIFSFSSHPLPNFDPSIPAYNQFPFFLPIHSSCSPPALCPPIHPSIHSSITPIYSSTLPTVHLSIHPPLLVFFHLSIHPSILPSIHLSFPPSNHLLLLDPYCPSIHPSLIPSIHPFSPPSVQIVIWCLMAVWLS